MYRSRRALLVAVCGAVPLAGCADSEGTSTGTTTLGEQPTGTTGTPTAEHAETATGSPEELDLREANVVAVEWSDEGGEEVEFAVTLYHDDDGEDGYANWWQVETVGGQRLGRRELRHAHSTAPFTRSETVPVPTGTTCVVIRGHDQTHGYGGRAMLVALDAGATRAVDQGTDSQRLTDADCP